MRLNQISSRAESERTMERLTIRNENGKPLCNKADCDGDCYKCDLTDKQQEKLAAYEDTKLEPEEVGELKKEHEISTESESALFKANEYKQKQIEVRQQIIDNYAQSARVIALYLKDYCDEKMPYSEMITEAARRANGKIAAQQQEITRLRAKVTDAINDYGTAVEMLAEKDERIASLAADKDQQAGRIMQMGTMLKEAQQHLMRYRKLYGSIGAEAIAEKIDALLGGKEDA